MNKPNDKLEIEKAIKFKNACLNHLGTPKSDFITKTKLGKLLWPESKGRTSNTRMNDLIRGGKLYRKSWLLDISEACSVDPNFLLGVPSVIDKQYSKFFPDEK